LRACGALSAACSAARPFNLVLHSAPFAESDAPYFHWHVEDRARVSYRACSPPAALSQ
jgi:hypothetical protein